MNLYENPPTILGPIIGDIIGSIYEFRNIKTTEFDMFNQKCCFTDDTILTVAVADSLLNKKPFDNTVAHYARQYPNTYGPGFKNWFNNDLKPYNSFGNGSAMRVSPVGFAFDDLDMVLDVAKQTAEITHNHPEGIKGAQAIASAIYLSRYNKSKIEIKDFITNKFNYNLDFTIDEIRPTYGFDPTCPGSVPQSIVAFLESSDFESAIRLAISIGGDSDTIACMTGGIASAYYEYIPTEMIDFAKKKLPSEFIELVYRFQTEQF